MFYFYVCSEFVNDDDLLNWFLVLNYKYLMKIILLDIFCCWNVLISILKSCIGCV